MRPARYLLPLCLLGLAACSSEDVQQTLGFDRHAPDEFVVYSRPPLSVPPEFDLQPPRPGEESPAAVSTEAQARSLLLGTQAKPATLDEAAKNVDPNVATAVTPVLSADAPSQADADFLKKFGADEASPDIRDQLAKDTVEAPKKQKKSQSLYESIVGDDKAEPVVDAKGEAERIRANRDDGKPITEGDTPDAKDKPKSVLDQVF